MSISCHISAIILPRHDALHNYIRETVDCLVLQFIYYTKIFLRHLNAGVAHQ